jgi:hypothetical protein
MIYVYTGTAGTHAATTMIYVYTGTAGTHAATTMIDVYTGTAGTHAATTMIYVKTTVDQCALRALGQHMRVGEGTLCP